LSGKHGCSTCVAVGIDALEKLVIGDIEHIGDEREAMAAVTTN